MSESEQLALAYQDQAPAVVAEVPDQETTAPQESTGYPPVPSDVEPPPPIELVIEYEPTDPFDLDEVETPTPFVGYDDDDSDRGEDRSNRKNRTQEWLNSIEPDAPIVARPGCPTKAERNAGDPAWRVDGQGFARFRGQGKRGLPADATQDRIDLDQAMSELRGGCELLLAAHELRGRERAPAIRAACGRLALSTRFVDEVIIRRGGTPWDCK